MIDYFSHIPILHLVTYCIIFVGDVTKADTTLKVTLIDEITTLKIFWLSEHDQQFNFCFPKEYSHAPKVSCGFCVCHAFLSVHCSPVVTFWEMANLLALSCMMFYNVLSLSLVVSWVRLVT